MISVSDPVTLINLVLCMGVVILSWWWHRRSGSRTPLYVALAFGLFAISHATVLLDPQLYLEPVMVMVRVSGYALVFIGLVFIARDITERKQADETLKRSERQLADIINFLPDATFVIDRNGTVLAWNRAMEEMTGVPAGQILGKGDHEYAIPFYGQRRPILIDLVFESDEEIEKNYYHIIRKEGDTIVAESDLPRPMGKVGTLWGKASPLYDETGAKIGAIESIRDITGRKRAEEEREKIRSWQAGVNRILESVLAPVPSDQKLKIITDGVVDTFGADFCRIWLIGRGDLCNTGCMHAEAAEGAHLCRYRDRCLHLKASSGRYTHIDGKAHRRVPFGAYKIGRIASGEETKFLTNDVEHDPRVHDHAWARSLGLMAFAGYRLKPPDGDVLGVFALFARFPISPDMDVILEGLSRAISLAIQKDIADRALRESGEQFRNVVETQTEFISRFRPDGIHVFVNEAYCRYFGKTCSEFIGKKFRPEIPPEDRARVREHFALLSRDHPVSAIDHRIIMPDGTTRWQRWVDRAISPSTRLWEGISPISNRRKQPSVTARTNSKT